MSTRKKTAQMFFIPCVNASTGSQKVKLLNGTSSLTVRGEYSEALADSDKLDKQAKVLKATKQDIVTLEFINKSPLSLKVYDERFSLYEEIWVHNSAFTLPNEVGI
jgi:hypothetical protein